MSQSLQPLHFLHRAWRHQELQAFMLCRGQRASVQVLIPRTIQRAWRLKLEEKFWKWMSRTKGSRSSNRPSPICPEDRLIRTRLLTFAERWLSRAVLFSMSMEERCTSSMATSGRMQRMKRIGSKVKELAKVSSRLATNTFPFGSLLRNAWIAPLGGLFDWVKENIIFLFLL